MTSTFFGLDLALRALKTQQRAIDVTNHNIANAATPGYSRQALSLAATMPYTLPAFNRDGLPGQLGTGVVPGPITRARDVFVDFQYRREVAVRDEARTRNTYLGQLEAIFNEPSDAGLNAALDDFWNAWQTVANNPTDTSARTVLLEEAEVVASTFQGLSRQVSDLERDAEIEIGRTVDRINVIAAEIARYNVQIAQVQGIGDNPNDLRDQRDRLLDELAGYVSITYTENALGAVNVFVGDHALVDVRGAHALVAGDPTRGEALLSWADDGQAVQAEGGSLGALVDLHETTLPAYRASLDALAARLIQSVNGLHVTGYGLDGTHGVPFFSGADAATIQVSSAVSGRPDAIAVSATPDAPGNNATALAIANLRSVRTALAPIGLQPGAAVPGTGVFYSYVDVSGVAPGTNFQLTSDGVGNLTLTRADGVSQTLAVADLTAPGTQELFFDQLGVRITLTGGGGAGDTGAAIASGLVGPLSTMPGPATIGEQYGSLVSQLGAEAAGSADLTANQELLVQQLEDQRQAFSSVSLDEETANLLKYQHAYEAAAQVLATVDRMLGTLIETMGRVGR